MPVLRHLSVFDFTKGSVRCAYEPRSSFHRNQEVDVALCPKKVGDGGPGVGVRLGPLSQLLLMQ